MSGYMIIFIVCCVLLLISTVGLIIAINSKKLGVAITAHILSILFTIGGTFSALVVF